MKSSFRLCFEIFLALLLIVAGIYVLVQHTHQNETPTTGNKNPTQIEDKKETDFKTFLLEGKVALYDGANIMKKEGYRPATIDELIDYDQINPKNAHESRIYAFGGPVTRNPGGDFFISSMQRFGRQRNLELHHQAEFFKSNDNLLCLGVRIKE